jgi:exodeoxyribonuclease VII small subunit
VDVDELSEKVKRAAELITFCQSRLRETDVQVKKVIEKFEKSIPVESPEEN